MDHETIASLPLSWCMKRVWFLLPYLLKGKNWFKLWRNSSPSQYSIDQHQISCCFETLVKHLAWNLLTCKGQQKPSLRRKCSQLQHTKETRCHVQGVLLDWTLDIKQVAVQCIWGHSASFKNQDWTQNYSPFRNLVLRIVLWLFKRMTLFWRNSHWSTEG